MLSGDTKEMLSGDDARRFAGRPRPRHTLPGDTKEMLPGDESPRRSRMRYQGTTPLLGQASPSLATPHRLHGIRELRGVISALRSPSRMA